MNKRSSPLHKDGTRAYEMLRSAQFVVIVMEEGGISEPEFDFNRTTYYGLRQIGQLVSVAKERFSKPKPTRP